MLKKHAVLCLIAHPRIEKYSVPGKFIQKNLGSCIKKAVSWLLAVPFLFLVVQGRPGPAALLAGEGGIGREVKAQIWAERGLRQIYYYLGTINPAVSNYGSQEEKRIFKRCVNHYLQSRIFFLAYRFNDSYQELRRAELLLIQLYERIVEESRFTVHRRLVGMADRVLYDRSIHTRKYLSLGLRDLEVARLKTQNEYNTRPWLYMLKLNDLSEALKLVRHANRYYMILAIRYESLYPSLQERITFEKGRRLIVSGFPSRQPKMLLQHSDNYFRVGKDRRDLLLEYQDNPDLPSLREALPKGWRVKDEPRYR